jgi:hypothetical protein
MSNEIPEDVQTLVCAKSWLKVNIDSLNNVDGNQSVKEEIVKLLNAIELIDKIIFEKMPKGEDCGE